MKAYYNENDPRAAAWLRQLISEKHIMNGDVDERSIKEVQAEDLVGYTQHHFFAGIGGWPLALQLAGWPDEKPVWTGSCPCQPFSAAGKNKGKSDERHLWPDFFNLIKQCRPIAVFGEQVESAIRHGWLDDLQADLEREGYTVGAAVLGAHSVGSYHIRQRLFWVAHAERAGFQERNGIDRVSRKTTGPASRQAAVSGGLVDNAETIGHKRHSSAGRQAGNRPEFSGSINRMAYTECQADRCEKNAADYEKPEAVGSSDRPGGRSGSPGRLPNPESAVVRPIPPAWNEQSDQPNDWIFCRDGKVRPIESGTFPLVNGVSKGLVHGGDRCQSANEEIDPNNSPEARVMRLRGYGNAIVPQVAAEFIAAFQEVAAC